MAAAAAEAAASNTTTDAPTRSQGDLRSPVRSLLLSLFNYGRTLVAPYFLIIGKNAMLERWLKLGRENGHLLVLFTMMMMRATIGLSLCHRVYVCECVVNSCRDKAAKICNASSATRWLRH